MPKRLFDACLRQAAFEISNAIPVEKSQANAKSQFLQSAVNPGLDVAGSPYLIAKEWVALLDVLVCSLPRIGVPSQLRIQPPIKLNGVTNWELSSPADENGTLHRYVTVDYWSESDFKREVHGWWVAGDVAASNRKLVLHVIEIGQMRNGKRASDWVRGWRHPSIPHLPIKFRHSDGRPMKGWNAVRFAEGAFDTEEWCDRLWKEGVGTSLTRTITVEPPNETQRANVIRDILVESARMREMEMEAVSWRAAAMSRGACDGIVPCPYQDVCYGGIVNVEESGLYVRRQPSAAASRTVSALLA